VISKCATLLPIIGKLGGHVSRIRFGLELFGHEEHEDGSGRDALEVEELACRGTEKPSPIGWKAQLLFQLDIKDFDI
jgi:hypothetical protein